MTTSFNSQTLFQYGRTLNTHDGLKILATLLMIIDHVGIYFLDDNSFCRLMGRGAAPLFFFLVGYSGKVHLSAFLIVYGIILSFTGGILADHIWINILLNFVVIHFLLQYAPLERLPLMIRLIAFVVLTALTAPVYAYLEYGFLGILVAYSGKSLADKEPSAPLWMGATLTIFAIYQAITFKYLNSTTKLIELGVLFLILFFLFRSYTLRPLTCPRKLQIPAMIIARYSLHIYFYHLIIFQGIYIILRPYLIRPYFN